MFHVEVNHERELNAVEVADAFEEVEGKSTDAVSSGRHNVLDSAAVDSFQKGRKPGPLEVDAGRDVGEDGVAWVCAREELFLAFEVCSLFRSRDARVDGSGGCGSGGRGGGGGGGGGRFILLLLALTAHRAQLQRVDIVQTMSVRGFLGANTTLLSPTSKGTGTDSELLRGFARRDQAGHGRR